MSHDVPFQVTVHPFQSCVMGSCAYEQGNTAASNALVHIGGLTDGPHTSGFSRRVGKHLQEAEDLDYSMFEIRLRSSFNGFGTSSLKEDVEDISAVVKYLRSIGRKKIVLMGHSTGCQDCIEYADYAKHSSEPVDGYVLIAPVSDREGMGDHFPNWRESLDVAEKLMKEGKGDHLMPVEHVPAVLGGAPMTAYRLWSLVAPGGDDDYFSSDLPDETVARVWGRFDKPVLALHCAEDEFMPPTVDKDVLNKRYRDANPKMVSSLSGLCPGATHTVGSEESRAWLSKRVQQFLAQEIR